MTRSRAARPTDLRGLAVQASLIVHNLEIGHRDEQIPMVRHIAEQLEALAPEGLTGA